MFLSCESGEGIPELLQIIENKQTQQQRTFFIPHDKYHLVVKSRKSLSNEEAEDNGIRMTTHRVNAF